MPIYGTDNSETLNGTTGDDTLYGGAGNDTIDAAAGNDFIAGDEGADVIEGGMGSDSILGGAGNDLIRAGDDNDWVNYLGETGNDTVYGGNGNDVVQLSSSTGVKTLFGESGDDTLEGGIDGDALDGGAGNDFLDGGVGHDALLGGLDNDTLSGGEGNDTLDGGDGNDFIRGEDGADIIVGGAGVDSITGGAGNDLIQAGDGDDWVTYTDDVGDDTVYGGSGNDLVNYNGSTGKKRVFGELGNDNLSGGVEADTLDGGDGNDSLSGGNGHDSIIGASGDDTLSGGLGDDMLLAGDGVDSLMGGDGSDTLDGGNGNDSLNGSDGADSLDAGAGNDFVSGGEGADVIAAGSGNDSISGGNGNDLINAGDGDDWLSYAGETGDDTVYGGGGHDVLNFNVSAGKKLLFGEAGKDTITAGLADDTIDGGDDDDSLIGGNGADSILGGSGNDSIIGGAGSDFIDAGAGDDSLSYADETGDDTVHGGDGNDRLNFYGSTGKKNLLGGAGNDSLSGGTDNDTLDGGTGDDSLSGGTGDDTYLIDSRFDRVVDEGGTDTAVVSADWVKIPSTIEQVSYTNGARALPYWISALLYDSASGGYFKSLLGGANDIYFAFPATIPSYDTDPDHKSGYTAFDATQKANTRTALSYIESLIDLNFIEIDNPARLNAIAFALNQQSDSGGYSFAPADNFLASDVFLNRVEYNATLNPGTYGAQVLIHEIGHAIGLKHPFDAQDSDGGMAEPPYLTGSEDSTQWTQMSYTDRALDYQLRFSPLDVAALQYLYGPNSASRAGNDSYVLKTDEPNFIWDGAGLDTLDASVASQGVTLALEPGEWSYFGAARAANITAPGQITINFGTVIENVQGSAFADRILGNEQGNVLQGGNGVDQLEGRAGNDSLHGGDGDDSLDGGEGDDLLSGGAGNDMLNGGAGNDSLLLSGARQSYSILWNPADKLLTFSSNTEGVDTVSGIETVQFSDVTVSAATFQTSGFVQSAFTPLPRVRIKTSVGDLVVELESERAPGTVTNFMRYVDANFYDGTEFHRIISTFMAQGGGFDYVGGQYVPKTPPYAAIALEKTSATGLSNTVGTLAMARTTVANSATSQFFINFVDNKFLDAASQPDGNGYAVFGRVVPGVTASATLQALKQVQVVSNGAPVPEVSQPTSAITLIDVLAEPAATTALPLGTVTIGGALRPGATLTAANTLVDADGIPAAGQSGAISYYWKVDGTFLPGATGATLALTQAQVGKAVSVSASYTDLKGTTGSVTSSAVVIENHPDRPTGRVVIQGTPTSGATLTATHTLSDLDGIPATGQAGAPTWQWRVGGVPIAGATQSSFTVGASDVGKPITASVSYTDLGGMYESVTSAPAGSYTPSVAPSLSRAWLRTSYGDLLIELEAQKAPITVANFVNYLKTGFYNGTVFHRVIDGFMVQGGGFTFDSDKSQYAPKAATSPAIALEKTTTTGLSNLRGTIAMARTDEPNSATSEFFINDADNALLNASSTRDGYAVFGRLVDGYGTLDLLSRVPVTSNGTERSLPTTVVAISGSYYDAAPPGGDVLITGLAMQGQTLRAEHTLVDPDGFGANGVIGWQWRVDGVPISNTGGASLFLTESMVGRSVSVQAIYRDAKNNYGYVASAPSSTILAIDAVAPTVSVYSHKTQLKPGQTASIVFSLSEASHDFSLDDITVSGGVLSSLAGFGTSYMATFTPTAGAAAASVRVASGMFTDIAGNANADGSDANNLVSLAIDASVPTFSGVQGVAYHWKTHAALSDVRVSATRTSELSSGESAVFDNTGPDGVFELQLGQADTHRFTPTRALTAGETGSAISAADALAALKLSVGLNPNTDPDGAGPLTAPPVSPYQFLAADVNGDGRVSAADALAILKMAVKRTDAPAREWLFVPEGQDFWNETAAGGQGAFTTTRTSVKDVSGTSAGLLPADLAWTAGKDLNLVAVLKGDVNGSWSAPTGTQALPDAYFHALVAVNPLAMHVNQFGITSTAVIGG
jgi:cyclophilin family peptidyl-prolyl cis-trans isomerase/Ca2+-binding RTX toxin-like protein